LKSSYIFLAYCILISCGACVRTASTPTELQNLFTRPEYIANGDGWAEARRRRAIEVFFEKQNRRVSTRQYDLPYLAASAKYKGTALSVIGEGNAAPLRLTYALFFSAARERSEYQSRQFQCDQIFGTVLSALPELLRRHRQIDFAMTDSCLRLTASPRDKT